MNQRAYLGGRPTLLDVAKGAVETFVKVRAVSSTRQKFVFVIDLFISCYCGRLMDIIL